MVNVCVCFQVVLCVCLKGSDPNASPSEGDSNEKYQRCLLHRSPQCQCQASTCKQTKCYTLLDTLLLNTLLNQVVRSLSTSTDDSDFNVSLYHNCPRGLTFMRWGMLLFMSLAQTNQACPFFLILFFCLFPSSWPFQLYFVPQILPTTLRFLTLFFRSYFSPIGLFSYISLYENLHQP